MNLEELTKSQVVLLTLLISFVTSMATGIVAVSLMEQGVSPVITTVNKIVEKTKEVIVKVEDPKDPVIITEEKTVVIHEEDLVASAITKNKDASIAIYKSITVEVNTDNTASNTESTDEQATTTDAETSTQVASVVVALGSATTTVATETKLVFVARGVVLGAGIVATDASMLDEEMTEYTIIANSGKHTTATVTTSVGGVALLAADVRGGVEFVSTNSLEHGQVVIVLSGTDRMRVIKTIIAEMGTNAIDTNAGNISPGSLLINLDGKVVGLSTGVSRKAGKSWFTTANKIESVLHSTDNTDI